MKVTKYKNGVFRVTKSDVNIIMKEGSNVSTEYLYHTYIYNNIDLPCRKFIVKPIGEISENAYVMEYVKGVTLFEYLQTATKTQIQKVMNQVRTVLVCLWKMGFVHGDAHLNNILVTPQNNIKLIDFGFTVKVDKLNKIRTMEDLKTWFARAWTKVLQTHKIPQGNPNIIYFDPNYIPFYATKHKALLTSKASFPTKFLSQYSLS